MSDPVGRLGAQFDAYSRRARLAPALLLLLGPVAVALGVGVPQWPTVAPVVGVAAAMGLPSAFADWVRRRGQQLQGRLWSKWGGNPVVEGLRGDGLVNKRRREVLAAATSMPVDELTHPQFEEAVKNAVRQLISATRDRTAYPLIFAENKEYGFARNLLAVRDMGVAVSALAMLAGIGLVIVSTGTSRLSTLGTFLGALAAASATAMWTWYPSEDRVKAAARDYRDRLLEALDAGALE